MINKGLIIYEWFAIITSLALVILRLYVRVYLPGTISKNPREWIKWNDVFVFLAWLCFLVQGIMETYEVNLKYYQGYYKAIGDKEAMREVTIIYKMFLAFPLLYFSCLYCVKAAMLFYYTEIVAFTTYKRVWLLVMIAFGVIGTSYLNTLVNILWGCEDSNISSYWSFDPDTGEQLCYGSDAIYFAPNIWHAITDILVCSISFVLVRGVALARHQRIAVYAVFSLGLLSTVFAIANVSVTLNSILSDPTKYYNIMRYLTVTEEFVSVSVACLPAFKKFVYRLLEKIRDRRGKSAGESTEELRLRSAERLERSVDRSVDEENPSPFKEQYGYGRESTVV